MNVKRKYVYQLVTEPKPSADVEVGDESGGGEETRDDENDGDGQQENGKIVVKFFDDENYGRAEGVGENGEGIGGVFVEMDSIHALSPAAMDRAERGIMVAKNKERHLCGEDLYGASWKFSPGMFGRRGEGEDRIGGKGDDEGKWWEVKYEVKGPKKDYVSVTQYTI